jgi:hypothetical protein
MPAIAKSVLIVVVTLAVVYRVSALRSVVIGQ